MIKDYFHEVKGIQFFQNPEEIKAFLGDIRHYYEELDLIIPDDEGDLVVNETDYILKEANGKVYAIEESDFNKLYRENEPCKVAPSDDECKRNRSFSTALSWLKRGHKVARKGWNGKGMYIWLVGSTRVQKSWIKEPGLLEAIGDQESIECLGFIRMKTADNKILSGWLASQTDMLSEDWEIYEEE